MLKPSLRIMRRFAEIDIVITLGLEDDQGGRIVDSHFDVAIRRSLGEVVILLTLLAAIDDTQLHGFIPTVISNRQALEFGASSHL